MTGNGCDPDLTRRRPPASFSHRLRAILVAATLGGALSSCLTPPPPAPVSGAPDSAPPIVGEVSTERLGPWRVEAYSVIVAGDDANPVEVTAVILSPPPSVVTVTPGGDAEAVTLRVGMEAVTLHVGGEAPPATGGISIGVTPWRYGRWRPVRGRDRVPVGVVQIGHRRFSAPVEPYWALVLTDGGEWDMAPQRSLVGVPTTERPPLLALGAFYPLIAAGVPVADDYPGRTIRAARVAVGGATGTVSDATLPDGRGFLVVIAATGSRPGGAPGRGGLTTGELAAIMGRYDLQWALNLDGGRSASLSAASPEGLPWRSPPIRPGPVRLELMR